jgi:4'-phosphopantetheinyl transferase
VEQEYRVKEIQFSHPSHSAWKLNNNVHIWKFPVLNAELSLLSASEKEIAGRFRFDADRNRNVVGRQALRFLLSKYLSVLPSEISIIAVNGQKPYISAPSSHIHFNISHSGDWVLVAMANDELGIDIEKIDTDFNHDDLIREHFSESEEVFISRAADPVSAFYFLWTRKEALTKAWGTGLQENLKMVSALDEYFFSDMHKKTWRLHSFKVSAFYPAAIAYSGASEELIYFDGSGIV